MIEDVLATVLYDECTSHAISERLLPALSNRSITISGSSASKARQPEATMGWSSTIRTRIGVGPAAASVRVVASHQMESRTLRHRHADPFEVHASQAQLLYGSIR